MAQLLTFTQFHLVGLKGVAMTALAQCLVDAGKTVTGSDVEADFVTHKILDSLNLDTQEGFDHPLPDNTQCVIYTAAHGGRTNPQVQLAVNQGIPVFSHAEALGQLFNEKQGIAVCGVGGKSTTTAMITWILQQAQLEPSFAVGVGNIPGLEKTGHWSETSQYFVAEADEYAVQPPTGQPDWQLVPRFSFLQPLVTVCTNLKYDHPDVYRDFEHTKQVYKAFFEHIKAGGSLIVNAQEMAIITSLSPTPPADLTLLSFGEVKGATMQLHSFAAETGKTVTEFSFNDQSYSLALQIPGKFNALNALGAILACTTIGVSVETSVAALATFRSTMRRFEFVGNINGVRYYDDYAHHPHEIAQAIQALNEWFPEQRKVIAFQSHTFSRTKELFADFVAAFAAAKEVVMIDIFPSARESFDPTVTSDGLCQAITQAHPETTAQNLKTIPDLASYLKRELKAGDVCLTVGAGDIYEVYQQL